MNDGLCLSIQYMGDGSLQVYAFIQPENESWISDHGKSSEELDKWYGDWDALLRSAYQGADLIFAKNLYMLPTGFEWSHKPGVTLIGDAAHVFTPFAGEGVNCGMTDAMELADAIEIGDIRGFERKKFERTRKVSLLTLQNTINTLSQTPLACTVDGFGRRLGIGQPDKITSLDGMVLSDAMQKLIDQSDLYVK